MNVGAVRVLARTCSPTAFGSRAQKYFSAEQNDSSSKSVPSVRGMSRQQAFSYFRRVAFNRSSRMPRLTKPARENSHKLICGALETPDPRHGGDPPASPAANPRSAQTAARFSRSAFVITDTELRLIAAAAIIGLSSQPNTG